MSTSPATEVLERIRLLCDAQGDDSYVMVHALRSALDGARCGHEFRLDFRTVHHSWTCIRTEGHHGVHTDGDHTWSQDPDWSQPGIDVDDALEALDVLSEHLALAATMQRVRAAHTKAYTEGRGGKRIPYCVEDSEAAQEWVSWPCPTARALAPDRSP